MNTEEKCEEILAKLTKKKPAHEVVVDMVRETIDVLKSESSDGTIASFLAERITAHLGILASLMEMLKRMVIPKKHFDEVFEALRKIKQDYPSEHAEKLLPERFFLILVMSQPDSKKEDGMVKSEKEVGHRMPQDCLKEAEVSELRKFVENTDNSQEEREARIKKMFSKAKNCVLCKRAVLKVFGTQ